MHYILKKLQIKLDYIGKVLYLPKELSHWMKLWPKDIISDQSKDLDFVLTFVTNANSVQENAYKNISMLKPDRILWFAYPKISSGVQTDINRDTGRTPCKNLVFILSE